jgi:hypothetical protein
MERVPAPFLKLLAEDREVFNSLPQRVKQQVRRPRAPPPPALRSATSAPCPCVHRARRRVRRAGGPGLLSAPLMLRAAMMVR